MVRLSMTVAALVAGLTLSASTLGANEAGTIVVAVDGTGDHDSITDALAVATEGDMISVRPGMYEEFLSIDGAISVVGDGDPEAIILSWNVADPPVVRMSDATGNSRA